MHLLKHLSQHLEDWKIQNRWHWHLNWASPLLQQNKSKHFNFYALFYNKHLSIYLRYTPFQTLDNYNNNQ